MSKYLVRASRKYFSKNVKSVDVVIMNVSGIFSHSSLVRTHEFSLKFRYNRFATPIGAGSAHASVHIHATCTHMPKYLFDFVPQGRIDYVRSSLVATLNFSVFGILEYHTWRYRTHRVQYRRKIYSKGNTHVIDFAVVDPKKKIICIHEYDICVVTFLKINISMVLPRFSSLPRAESISISSHCHYSNVCHVVFRFNESVLRVT